MAQKFRTSRLAWKAGVYHCISGGMAEATKIIGTIVGLCGGAVIFDYCCYYQAAIVTRLSDRRIETESRFDDPPYHPFIHPLLWLIATFFVVPIFLLVVLNVGNEALAYVTAGAAACFFYARCWLMRKGIS